MKLILVVGIIVLMAAFSCKANAQANVEHDSCYQLADSLNLLSYNIYEDRPDSAIFFANQALLTARACSNDYQKSWALNNLGAAHYVKANYETSIAYHEDALAIHIAMNDSFELGHTYNYLGNAYMDQGALQTALDYYIQATEILSALNNKSSLATIFYNMSLVHYDQLRMTSAIGYMKQAADYAKESDFPSIEYDAYASLLLYYAEENRLDSAKKYLELAKPYFIGTDAATQISLGYFYAFEGFYEATLKNYREADQLLAKSEAIFVAIDDPYSNANLLYYKGKVALLRGNISQAQAYAKQALKLAQSINALFRVIEIRSLQAQLYARSGNYKQAWVIDQEVDSINHELSSFDSEKQLLNRRLKQVERKNKSLTSQKFKLQKDVTKKTKLIERKDTLILFFVAFLIAALTYLFYLYKLYTGRKRLIETKDKILSVLGHDLRTPVNQLQSIISLAREGLLSKDEEESLFRNISLSLDRISKSLENILHWSKTHLIGSQTTQEPLNLLTSTEDAVGFHERSLLDKEVNLTIGEELGSIEIAADRAQFQIILRNLIGNALKYSYRGDSIKVSAVQDSSARKASISIQDSGTGMTKMEINRILNFSFNQSKLGTSQEQGTGLGLVLVKHFLKLNKGSLSVSSEPGRGSVFTCTLPLAT